MEGKKRNGKKKTNRFESLMKRAPTSLAPSPSIIHSCSLLSNMFGKEVEMKQHHHHHLGTVRVFTWFFSLPRWTGPATILYAGEEGLGAPLRASSDLLSPLSLSLCLGSPYFFCCTAEGGEDKCLPLENAEWGGGSVPFHLHTQKQERPRKTKQKLCHYICVYI